MSISNLFTNNLKVWQNLNVNHLEANSAVVGNIETDNVISDDVISNTIETDSVQPRTTTTLKLQRPLSFVFNEEYGHYTMTFLNINNVSGFTQPNLVQIFNAGTPSYMPQVLTAPFRLSIIERGAYMFNIVCINTGVLATVDSYQIKISSTTFGAVIGNLSEGVGTGAGIGQYQLHNSCVAPLNSNDIIKFEMHLSNGISATLQNFNATLFVFRIK
jgi:hypothetical protein